MKRTNLLFSFLSLILDVIVLFGTFLFAYFLRYMFPLTALPYGIKISIGEYLQILFLVVPIWVIIFSIFGLYKIGSSYRIATVLIKILWAVSFSVVFSITVMFVLKNVDFSRLMVIYIWVVAIVSLSIFRILFHLLNRLLLRKGIGLKRVIILGKNKKTDLLLRYIGNDPNSGYKLVKVFRVNKKPSIPELKRIIKKEKIDEVIQSEPFTNPQKNLNFLEVLQENQVAYKQVPSLLEVKKGRFHLDTLGDVPILEFRGTPLEGWGRIVKRLFDFIFSLIAIVVLSPFFLIIAMVIRLDSPGPIFFKQKRVSKGRDFYLYKFRSMIKGADKLKKKLKELNEREGPMFKIKNDPRVTKVGRFLRKSRLDELPQLFNVLRGEMSLIGPRPHLQDEIKNYKKHHKKVLFIKPGITGLAQISGASDLDFEDEVRLDAYYIDNWSFWLDLIILAKTIGVVASRKGAS